MSTAVETMNKQDFSNFVTEKEIQYINDPILLSSLSIAYYSYHFWKN